MEILATRYKLDPYRTFTKAFVMEVGNLSERYFDAMSSPESDPEGNRDTATTEASSRVASSQCEEDTISILFTHNHLSSLWQFMKDQFRLTFLPPEGTPTDRPVSSSIPAHSQPALLEPYPTVVSPLLTAKYLCSSSTPTDDNTEAEPTFDVLGCRSLLFNPTALTAYISDQMRWWRGQRLPRGVEPVDAWKCRSCDFRGECSWREERELQFSSQGRRGSEPAVEAANAITITTATETEAAAAGSGADAAAATAAV